MRAPGPGRCQDARHRDRHRAHLFTVWLLHSRHTKTGVAQALAPTGAVLVLACAELGDSGVLAAGLVGALTVVVGLLLPARQG
ncbi:hypothetical protein [Kitasatospora sp. NPDC087314]|uniref:hypothetical protein n=1 Tax=Kitasatospora sp. NPDC087314 TaxID=3364068 RepID=UPI0037FBDF7A